MLIMIEVEVKSNDTRYINYIYMYSVHVHDSRCT